MKKLNTPVKRIGAIFIVIGMILMLIAGIVRNYKATIFGNPYYNSPNFLQIFLTWLEKFTNSLVASLTFETWSSDFSLLMLSGFSLFICGLLMSYFYDFTIGRIVHWVKNGSL